MIGLSFKEQIERFVEERISSFHQSRATNINALKLSDVLRAKNPYLFRAKHLESASALVEAIMDARLSSAEEGMFGSFLEDLAVFVSEQKCNGRKSGITGMDIELERNDTRYIIAVKSGKNWGNSTQHKKLRENFATAVKVLKQNRSMKKLQPTLGICYGRFKAVDNGVYLHIGGQAFWELISQEPDLYKDLIEPIGYKAHEFNRAFLENKQHVLNRMIREFTERFCMADGKIDWEQLVELVSHNLE